MFNMRNWLRQAPKPAKLKILTTTGEEQVIVLGQGRTRWLAAEETLATCGAVQVQCLDAQDNVLRGRRLSEEEGESLGQDPDSGGSNEAATEVARAKAESRSFLGQAAMLEAYGRAINEAHRTGAEAASSSQDKLVSLVEVLTNHLSIAITNLHNVSANFSNLMQQMGGGRGDEDGNGAMVQQLMTAAIAGMAARGGLPGGAPAQTNGASKGK